MLVSIVLTFPGLLLIIYLSSDHFCIHWIRTVVPFFQQLVHKTVRTAEIYIEIKYNLIILVFAPARWRYVVILPSLAQESLFVSHSPITFKHVGTCESSTLAYRQCRMPPALHSRLLKALSKMRSQPGKIALKQRVLNLFWKFCYIL